MAQIQCKIDLKMLIELLNLENDFRLNICTSLFVLFSRSFVNFN